MREMLAAIFGIGAILAQRLLIRCDFPDRRERRASQLIRDQATSSSFTMMLYRRKSPISVCTLCSSESSCEPVDPRRIRNVRQRASRQAPPLQGRGWREVVA